MSTTNGEVTLEALEMVREIIASTIPVGSTNAKRLDAKVEEVMSRGEGVVRNTKALLVLHDLVKDIIQVSCLIAIQRGET